MVTRIQEGGTGQTTAPGARIALGLSDAEIITIAGGGGTFYQPLDSDLTAIAALTTLSYGRGFLVRGDAAATRTYMGLGTIATETATDYLLVTTAASLYQPLSTHLTTLVSLDKTNNNFIVTNGTTFTYVNGSAARASLGLGTMATETAADYSTTVVTDGKYVRYDTSQSLSTAQKAQARTNTGAAENIYAWNRVVNPSFVFAQRAVTTPLNSGTSGSRFADCWLASCGTSAASIAVTRQTITNPSGTRVRVRLVVDTADTSLAATETFTLLQAIEDYRLTDLLWGTANAREIFVRFGFKGPAGTYAISVRNAAVTRSYIREFTISAGQANTDVVVSTTIPGDTSGTWPLTGGVGIYLSVTLATGSTYQTTANAWQGGNFLGTSSTSNGMGTATNTFEFFDFELYRNDENTPPKYVAQNLGEVFQDCLRYLYIGNGTIVDTNVASQTFTLPGIMRTNPTITGGGAGFTVAVAGNITTHFYQTTRAYQSLIFSAELV